MPGTDCRAAAAAPEPEREGVYALFAVTQDRGLHQISHWLAVTSQACGEMLLANGEKTGSQAISTVSGKDRYRPTLTAGPIFFGSLIQMCYATKPPLQEGLRVI